MQLLPQPGNQDPGKRDDSAEYALTPNLQLARNIYDIASRRWGNPQPTGRAGGWTEGYMTSRSDGSRIRESHFWHETKDGERDADTHSVTFEPGTLLRDCGVEISYGYYPSENPHMDPEVTWGIGEDNVFGVRLSVGRWADLIKKQAIEEKFQFNTNCITHIGDPDQRGLAIMLQFDPSTSFGAEYGNLSPREALEKAREYAAGMLDNASGVESGAPRLISS